MKNIDDLMWFDAVDILCNLDYTVPTGNKEFIEFLNVLRVEDKKTAKLIIQKWNEKNINQLEKLKEVK